MSTLRLPRERLLSTTILSLILIIVSCLFITLYNINTFKKHQLNDIQNYVERQQKNISYRLNLITNELKFASQNPLIISTLLDWDEDLAKMEAAQKYLINIHQGLNLLAAYILDGNGTCILSSDYRFIGNNYSFRPYFKKAIKTGFGTTVAKGVTSNTVGLYLARRIYSDDLLDKFVIVFKLDPLDLLESVLPNETEGLKTLLATKHGILLSSSKKLYILNELSKGDLSTIQQEHQFDGMHLKNLGFPPNTFNELVTFGKLTSSVQGKTFYLTYLPLLSNELGMVNIVSENFKTPLLHRLEKGIVLIDGLFLVAIFPLLYFAIALKRQQDALKRYERSLREYRTRIRLLDTAIEQTANSVVITDVNGVIEYVNPAFTEVTGYSAEEALGQKPSILKAGLQDKGFYEEMWNTLLSKKVWRGRFCNRRKDGTIYWEDAIISPVLNDQGEIIHFIAIKSDITKLVELEGQLKQKINELETIMDHVGAGIILVKNRRLVNVNKRFSELVGIPPEELIGKETRFLFESDEEFHEFARTWYPRLQQGETVQFEQAKRLADGELHWFHIVASAASPGKSLEEMEVVWMAHDITEIKRLQSQLEREKEKAEAANRAKSDFLASVSHEIRTPLNGVIGMLDLLESTSLGDKQLQFLKMAKNSAEILLFLINDILDFSKIEAGKLHLEELDFRLGPVLDQSLSSLDVLARQKGLELRSEINGAGDYCLRGDPYRLRQVLMNLIGNAVKFTEHGAVTVGTRVEAEDKESATVLFYVRDTGIGIPKERQRMLFQKFTQADSSISRRFGGTGLGLAICKNLVELMGGEIGVESEEGKGSAFWFRIPFKKGNRRANGCRELDNDSLDGKEWWIQGLSRALEGKRVLVVDDNLINQQILISILNKLGIETHGVSTGRDAIEALATIAYDLVFMDIQMPDMDGITATRLIRERSTDVIYPDIPIVALTAHIVEDEGKFFLSKGFDDILTKPIIKERLIQCLKRWLVKGPGEHLVQDPPRESSDEKSPSKETLPSFDEKELRARALDDTAIVERVLDVYMKNTPNTLRDLEEAVAKGEEGQVLFHAHSLKGASSNIGAKRLAALAEEMEELAKDFTESKSRIHALVDEVKEEFERLKGLLRDAVGKNRSGTKK